MGRQTSEIDVTGAPRDESVHPTVRRRVRRVLREWSWRAVQYCADRAWIGITPLEKHIVICGFPRAGSTVLHLMLATCIPDVLAFSNERNALASARFRLNSRRFLLTKRPDDIFRIDKLTELYRRRRAELVLLLTLRDPRDVLVSYHANQPGNYYVSSRRWKAIYDKFREAACLPGALVVRFEELVLQTDKVEGAITRLLGCPSTGRFRDFHRSEVSTYDQAPLNGLRALDRSAVGRWRDQRHAHRIREILNDLPTFAGDLINLGYEKSDDWVTEYA